MHIESQCLKCIIRPILVMTTSTPEKTDGLKALDVAIEKIKETIISLGGVFNIQMAPKVVTATDEAELARRMERAEAENAEIADDDAEDDEEGIKYDEDGVNDEDEIMKESDEEKEKP